MLQAFLGALVAASMSSQAAPAPPAAPGTVSIADPNSLVTALQKAGYKAKLTYEEGKPEIESSAAGATFYLYFQNCESKDGCEDIMVQSAYDVAKDAITLDTINKFNKDNRWARAYLDDEKRPGAGDGPDLRRQAAGRRHIHRQREGLGRCPRPLPQGD